MKAKWIGRVLVAALWASPVCAEAQHWEAADAVEIRRTRFGVPHVRAGDLYGAGFGLGYVESEDHGERVFEGFLRARGRLALHEGADAIESDFIRRRTHVIAGNAWSRLDADVRAMMEGFAAGVEHYLALHPDERPAALDLPLSGVDVHAMYIGWYDVGEARELVERLEAADSASAEPGRGGQEDRPARSVDADTDYGRAFEAIESSAGSNAWAFDPTRTRSQTALLLRNPHLSWDAGYYEAHLTVPGVLDFYGDFRIGGLFGIVGGFNRNLGWTTTNNYPDLTEVYRVRKDPELPRHYVLDGVSYPLRQETVTVEVRDEEAYASSDGIGTAVRTYWSTHMGPVVHETDTEIYVMRSADQGEFRRGEQFLAMMRAGDLNEWLSAMREQRISSSNYTYADRAGNIFYVWNAKLPRLPHPYTRDEPVLATSAQDFWSETYRFDRLPQLLNPAGGYLRNENDPPYWTNLNETLPRSSFPENMPDPRLRFRSQLSLELVHGDDRLDLEELIERKHSPRMLLADRVKDDLIAAVRLGDASDVARAAADLLIRWDNTASIESRGSALFELWFARYAETTDSTRVFKEPWTELAPATTPHGLGDHEGALEALEWAIEEATRRWGSWDVSWGEVHRVRHGDVDVPVAGCAGALGCFRTLAFQDDEDGKRSVRSGDGWVLAVEFGNVPRAYSILAYGQSSREDSEHFDDQAEMFSRGEMKRVAFTDADIALNLVRSYAPGREVEP